MLFADELSPSVLQLLNLIATAAITAWVTVQTRRIETHKKDGEVRWKEERKRCDRLERRVKVLEAKQKPAPKTRPRK